MIEHLDDNLSTSEPMDTNIGIDSGVEEFWEQALRERNAKKSEELHVLSAFCGYLQDLRALGIMAGVLVGSRPDDKRSYIWNVFLEDFDLEHAGGSAFRKLPIRISKLKKELSPVIPLRVSYANLSQLRKLEESCKKQEMLTWYVPF